MACKNYQRNFTFSNFLIKESINMSELNFHTTPCIIQKPNALIERLPSLVKAYSATSVLIVTDGGIVKLGYVEIAKKALEQEGLKVMVFDQVVADPPVAIVNDAIAMARECQSEVIIGLGGGSSIDTAKIVALAQNEFSKVEDLIGQDIAHLSKLPLFAIPTTAGTGSEVTFVSVLTAKDGSKQAIYSPKILPDVALLDAQLTLKLPRHITSASALDAMVHAVEAYTSRTKKNPVADALAVKGLQLLWQNFYKVLSNGNDVDARSAMLLGSTLAGMAFVNASVAAVHGLSYPLGVRFHVPHGHANALVMGAVFRFNLPAATPLYAQLAYAVDADATTAQLDEVAAAEWFVSQLETFLSKSGLETKLSELGVTEADLPLLAEDMLNNYARLIATNPRDMTIEDVESLYASVY